MKGNHILHRTSFAALDENSQKVVRDLFNLTYQEGHPLGPDTLPLFTHSNSAPVAASLPERRWLATRLDIYGSKLAAINVASFKFLNTTQKEALEEDLLLTFYFLSAQFLIDKIDDPRQAQKDRIKQIGHCAQLLQQLRKHIQSPSPKALFQQEIHDSASVKYLDLTLPDSSSLSIDTLIKKCRGSGITRFVISRMNEVNVLRLYWVWTGNFLNYLFLMLPENFMNRNQGKQTLAAITPVTGYMSWMLYYARLSVQLLLILKHTIPGGWMSNDEKKIPAWERFTTRLDLRKFGLINDSVWATANLACFFWLKGSGTLGYLGNVATVGLLLMDSILTIWRFIEENTQHRKDVKKFTDDKALLRAKIDAAEKDGDQHELDRLQHHWDALNEAEAHCKFEWKYKKRLLYKDMAYAITLMSAFVVVCAFVTPEGVFAPHDLLHFGVVGFGLCFMLTALNSVAGTAIEIDKAQKSKKLARLESKSLSDELKVAADLSVQNLLDLDIEYLRGVSNYQAKLTTFKLGKLVYGFSVDMLVPGVIFTSLLFWPLWRLAIPVSTVFIMLAILGHFFLERCEPQKLALPDSNSDKSEISGASDRPEKQKSSRGKWKHCFFSEEPKSNVEKLKNPEEQGPLMPSLV